MYSYRFPAIFGCYIHPFPLIIGYYYVEIGMRRLILMSEYKLQCLRRRQFGTQAAGRKFLRDN